MRFKKSKKQKPAANTQKPAGQKIETFDTNLSFKFVPGNDEHPAFLRIVDPSEAIDGPNGKTSGQKIPLYTLDEQIPLVCERIYPQLFSLFKLCRDDLEDSVKAEIDNVYTTWIYSAADYSQEPNNHRLIFWDNHPDAATFTFFKSEIPSCLLEKQEILRNVEDKKRTFVGPRGKLRRQAYDEEIKKREEEALSYLDFSCWSFLKLIFPDKYLVRLIKAANYLFYKYLRQSEFAADNGAAGLKTSDAKANLDRVRYRLDTTTRQDIISSATNDEMQRYSSNICNFYLWKIQLFNFLAQIFFDLQLFSSKDNDFKGVDNLQHLVNDNNLLFLDLQQQLRKNLRLMKEINSLDNYTHDLMRLIRDVGLNQNIYWHWYVYYLISYENKTITINEKQIQLSEFAYLVFLASILSQAVRQMYLDAFLVLKYCSIASQAKLGEILDKVNTVKKGGRLGDYHDLPPDFINERLVPFFRDVYQVFQVNTLNRLIDALMQFQKQYHDQDTYADFLAENTEKDDSEV